MSELLFCYHCRGHHPRESMRQFPTTLGLRWRCLRSIEAARQGIRERELFGKLQTEANRHTSRSQGQYAQHVRSLLQEQNGKLAAAGSRLAAGRE